jgi:hypothetical protein
VGGGDPDDPFRRSTASRDDGDDEENLRWAALEKLPTYDRMRRGIIRRALDAEGGGDNKLAGEVDLANLDPRDGRELMERVFKAVEDDNERLLRRFRDRLDLVGIELPQIEVRYEHLSVEADVHVGARALPTLLNSAINVLEVCALHLIASCMRSSIDPYVVPAGRGPHRHHPRSIRSIHWISVLVATKLLGSDVDGQVDFFFVSSTTFLEIWTFRPPVRWTVSRLVLVKLTNRMALHRAWTLDLRFLFPCLLDAVEFPRMCLLTFITLRTLHLSTRPTTTSPQQVPQLASYTEYTQACTYKK